MLSSVAFLWAAVAFSAAPSPVESRTGTSLPIHRRTGQLDANGAANPVWYRNHMESVRRKYERGFTNYERHTGSVHPLAHNSSIVKRGTGSNPLTDVDGSLWFGHISVGTPPVKFSVDYDTGSSDLFLPGAICTQNCDGHTRFDPHRSSTSKDLGLPFTDRYMDGSHVNGELYTDVVTISGLTVSNQTFGAASTYSDDFAVSNFPPDGLMGMGYQSISTFHKPPVFQTMQSQGVVDAGIFAFKLAMSGSELFLGGTNPAAYTGAFTYTPVTHPGYWQVHLEGISVNGSSAIGNGSSIIDTGTTLIIGDSTEVKSIIQKIPGALPAPAIYGAGLYMAPCNITYPIVSLTFGNKSWDVSSQTFLLGPIANNSMNCLLGIAEYYGSLGFWIVGDVFLQNVYTSFDLTNNQVGFAKLA